MPPRRATVLFTLLLLAAAHGAPAATIANYPPTDYTGTVGEPVISVAPTRPAYWAQTFVAPNGVLDSLTIQVSPRGPSISNVADNHLRVLITETNGQADAQSFRPTTLLFESATLTVPLQGAVQTFLLPLGGLIVTPGQTTRGSSMAGRRATGSGVRAESARAADSRTALRTSSAC